jgi:ribose 5-phosphate isomerase A|nr:ribose-5-phosphate isomerase RpiA [Kofleriaceae bacterium]
MASDAKSEVTSIDEAKRAAARAALAELPEHGVIGLGTGSTTRFFIDAVGEAVKAGHRYTGVPTSEASRKQATELGIPLLPDDGPWEIAVCVDGADEVDDKLDLIKGGGGAQTREKIVNHSAARNVIIVDGSKLSARLGDKWPVPVEVLPFAHLATRSHLAKLGEPKLRLRDGQPWRTDAGNLIYDVHCGRIADAPALDLAMHGIPGVVETGLFIRRCDIVLVAEPTGVRKLTRSTPR